MAVLNQPKNTMIWSGIFFNNPTLKNETEENMDELKPCIKCGGKGVERIGYGLPYFVCGIPMGRTIGTIIQCSDCGHQTNAYGGDYTMAYKEWNEMEAKEE